jgi:hypothetical protein
MGAHRRLYQGPVASPHYLMLLDPAILCLIIEILQKAMIQQSPMLLHAGTKMVHGRS